MYMLKIITDSRICFHVFAIYISNYYIYLFILIKIHIFMNYCIYLFM